jgi:general secretion pathway protein D
MFFSPAIAEENGRFSASFKETDIVEFINTVSKNLNKTIIIDPAVKGQISVKSYEKLNDEEYYQFFLSVLEVYGFATVEMPNGVLKVLSDKNIKGSAIALEDGDDIKAGDEIIMRIVPLHNVTGKDLAPLLRQLNEASTSSVVHYAPSNILLITGRAAVVNQMVKIVENVDIIGSHAIRTIKLRHANAAEIVSIISTIYKKEEHSGHTSASIVADERTNSVLISGDEYARSLMAKTVFELDVEGKRRGTTKVIYLNHAKAEKLMSVLSGVSAQTEDGQRRSAEGAIANVAMMKNVVIKADERANALIINAAPDLMHDLEYIIKQLDIRRSQVLVEAIIAEVQDADGISLGLQWFNQHGGGTNFSDAETPIAGMKPGGMVNTLGKVSGIAAGFYHGNWAGLFTALQTNGHNNILATPSIVTLDNAEAEFNVGQDVPVLSGSQTTSGDNVFNTVERKSVGIKLKVKPQINKGDSVLLEVEQEVSSVDHTANDNNLGPTFNTRTVRNAVLVNNRDTVVIGGLLDTNNTAQSSKVPFLGNIPVVGHLFGTRSNTSNKRNLMLFIRPTIIREQDNYLRVTAHQREKFSAYLSDEVADRDFEKSLKKEAAIPPDNHAFLTILSDIYAFYAK